MIMNKRFSRDEFVTYKEKSAVHLTLRNLEFTVPGRDSHTVSVGLYEARMADIPAKRFRRHYIQTSCPMATMRLKLILDAIVITVDNFSQTHRVASA